MPLFERFLSTSKRQCPECLRSLPQRSFCEPDPPRCDDCQRRITERTTAEERDADAAAIAEQEQRVVDERAERKAAAAAARAERLAAAQPIIQAQRVLAFGPGSEPSEPLSEWIERYDLASQARFEEWLRLNAAFECDRCGRRADVVEAGAAFELAVKQRVPGDAVARGLFRVFGRYGVRASRIQKELSVDYETAVELLEASERLGVSRRRGNGYVRAPKLCGPCYEELASHETEPTGGESVTVEREPIPPRLRFQVLQRDAFRCQYCGRSTRDGATLHLDHVVPFSKGGPTSEDNLITACERCNLGKSDSTVVG